MTKPRSAIDAAPRTGPVALIDMVRCPSHEARLAFPSLVKSVLLRNQGRLRWAGSIDHNVIGRLADGFHDILVSEFPSRETCVAALAERTAWQPENFVSEIRTWISAPAPTIERFATRLVTGINGIRGGGPPPFDAEHDPFPDLDEGMSGTRHLGPDRTAVESLIAADLERPMVMVNFLRFHDVARYAADAGDAISGAQAYARYGRNTLPLVGRIHGRIRWSGHRARSLTEDDPAAWHQIVCVQYPSRAAFIGMARSEAYRRATHHRDAGLEATELVSCTSHAEFF